MAGDEPGVQGGAQIAHVHIARGGGGEPGAHLPVGDAEEVQSKLDAGEPYVIRQRIPEGSTTFQDAVYGEITVDNADLDDQILITWRCRKSQTPSPAPPW